MSEMIERAVRAFAADVARQHEEGKPGPYIDIDYGLNDVVIDGRVDLIVAMRAAIMAMREPTQAMWDRGAEADREAECLDSEKAVLRVWDTMIDAALQETTKCK